MALLYADGFEHYGTGALNSGSVKEAFLAGEWSAGGSPFYIYQVSGNARTGDRYLEGSQNTDVRHIYPNTISNEVGAAVAMFIPAMPSADFNSPGFSITDEVNDYIVTILVAPNGSVQVYRGNYNGTLLGVTDTGIITASAWHHYELRILQDNVVGEVELRVNGEVELLLTNLDLGTVLPRFWRVGGSGSFTTSRRYDDLILWDTTGDVNNTFFGPARVTTQWLDADELGNQWSVVGAGSGAAALTELAPDGDTSYVSAATNNAVSEFSLASLPPEAEVISGIYVPTMAKLSSAGLGNMQTSVVSGASATSGKDNILTAVYTYRGDIFEKDPATGQLWTKNGLEQALIRIEKTA